MKPANGITSFANNGLPGQVPLPLFDTMFGARGSQPALSAAQGWPMQRPKDRLRTDSRG